MLSNPSLKRLHAALRGAGLTDHKDAMLESYGVSSSKDLTEAQCAELVQRLNASQRGRKPASDEIRQARSRVLLQAERYGVYDSSVKSSAERWKPFNRFMLDNRIAGKLLYQLGLDELRALERKLRKLVRQQEEKAADEAFQVINN
jgi:hypothetical protein